MARHSKNLYRVVAMVSVSFRVARFLALLLAVAPLALLAGCKGAGTTPTQTPGAPVAVVYTLTVASSNPAAGVPIAAAPADTNASTGGNTGFTLTYTSGTSVTLTAPALAGANIFTSWTGCTQTSGRTCTALVSANTTITANYANPAPVTYSLTVNSINPSSGVLVTLSHPDNNLLSTVTTSGTLTYNTGTTVTLTAPATVGSNAFANWAGCAQTAGATCTVTLTASTTVTANYTAPPVPNYTLTVNSTDPTSGVLVAASPADNNGSTGGNTSMQLSYPAGASVTLNAPATAGLEVFSSWTGCPQASARTCTVVLAGNATIVANYASAVTVSVTPSAQTATIGNSVQFNATVKGSSNTAVTWAVVTPAGAPQSPGTINAAGLYQTPYPAPASVTVTATSTADPVANGSVTLTLAAPAAAMGPALTVDTSAVDHAISPLIYGMNSYALAPALQAKLHIPVDRWGGDFTTRYNYLLDVSNSANDYYFENSINTNTAYPDVSQFNSQVAADAQYGSKTLAGVPLIGYTTKRISACSFSAAKYGAQKTTDPYNPDCGLGVLLSGAQITGNDPADTSTPIDQSFVSGWVNYLVKKFGPASAGGVGIYELDNEPEYYSAVHRDVHPAPMSYDEVTGKGIAYAKVIKAADPSALVSGPTISNFDTYFYSWQDLVTGWSTGPCYCYNGAPTDRQAHGNIPLLAYYLQQFQAAQTSGGTRLLDYLDLHTYFAAANAAFNPAGDTALQAARLDSTRVFWDPTYTDPAYTDPSVTTKPPAYPPQLIPFMKSLVAANYPGTRTAITEYAWGAQESINGAIAQADILGIFGKYALDLGTLWGPPDPVAQVPGVMAFQFFQNYDGSGSSFGNGSLNATTADQGKLSIYAARRSTDGVLTILVLNKTFGDLSSTLSLQTTAIAAKVFRYSNTNLAAIATQPDAPVTPVSGGKGSVTTTYPAQSITLLVLPY